MPARNLTIRDEGHAVDQVLTRMDEGSRELELERLHAVVRDNIMTDEVNRNGLGGIDPARLERSIDQVGEGFKFAKRPSTGGHFRRSLPAPACRSPDQLSASSLARKRMRDNGTLVPGGDP